MPVRFVSTSSKGAAQAVNFQADRRRIGFSGPTFELPWVDGAQDRLSLWMQMQAELSAHGLDAARRSPWVFWVVGVRGDARAWVFTPQLLPVEYGPSEGIPGRASSPVLRLAHRGEARFDLEMELDWTWSPEPRLTAARWWHRGAAELPWELSLP
jgi:hypothetical protein